MLRFFVLAACLSLLTIPATAILIPHEHMTVIPSGWRQTAKLPDANTSIGLSISIPLQNMDSLPFALKNVSTPSDSTYGQYLEVDEVLSHFGPPKASIDAVLSWLSDAGINSIYNSSMFSIDFLTTVEQVRFIHLAGKFQLIFPPGKHFVKCKLSLLYGRLYTKTPHLDVLDPSIFEGAY